MNLNLFEQRLVSQINNLYNTAPPNWWDEDFKESINGFYGQYSQLYDFLKAEGHDIKFDKLTKDNLWKLAREKFTKDNKARILHTAKTFKKEILAAQDILDDELRATYKIGAKIIPKEEIDTYCKEAADKWLHDELMKVFKSFLVRRYLLDRVPTEGVLVLYDEQGKRIKI